MTEYRAYLKRHYWRRVFPTLVGAGIVFGFCVSQLRRYSETGEYLLHPWLAVFFAGVAFGLIVVGLIATWEISRYTDPWSRSP